MLRLHRNKVEIVGQLAAGFPAGIEARIAFCTLTMQGQQAKTLPFFVSRLNLFRSDPVLQNLLANRKQAFCGSNRIRLR